MAKDPPRFQVKSFKELVSEESDRRVSLGEGDVEDHRESLSNNPFNPRSEVSADARHIVRHIWIVAVFLPIAFSLGAAFLWSLVK